MIDQKLYRETFSRLRASEEAKREVLERKRRGGGRLPQLLRGTVIAAAMCMALAVTAGAVNIATDGELFRRFTIVWTGEDELLATDGQGIEVQITLADQGPVWEQDGRVLELTAAEYRLLCLLMANEGRTLPRGRILDVLWDGNGNFVDDNTLSVYIRRLREKTEKDPSRPRMLLTVRGIGYRWEAENASEKG